MEGFFFWFIIKIVTDNNFFVIEKNAENYKKLVFNENDFFVLSKRNTC